MTSSWIRLVVTSRNASKSSEYCFKCTASYGWGILSSLNCKLRFCRAGNSSMYYSPACRTYEIAARFCDVVICPIHMSLTVYEFSFILFDLCLFITIFNFILNYELIVTFCIFTCHKIRILLIIYCCIWNCWIYFVTCLEVFWSVMS